MVGNYSIDRKTDCLSAIAGTRGSLIDTFGNGPKILRDNFDIHILKRRGSNNNTLIAYGKNLTGFELEEDDSDLITRIKPYATYTDNEQNSHIVYGPTVDSSRIDNYSVIRSVWMDFTEKFKDGEEVTKDKLRQMAINYFADNSCDLPRMTYKIEFELLAQTEEYKDYKILETVDMDDSVYIVNSKYGIRDQAKVIKTKYNPITEKYISVELGEPRTSLNSILGSTSDSVTKDEVQDMIDSSITSGINGADGVDGKDGVSITWKGTFAEHPSNPENGWAYYNSTDKKSYVYQDGTWYQMTVDGTDGINGNDGADGLSIVWKGELTSPPANPQENWVYKDTDNGIVYIYTGTAWEVMTYDGADGVDGTNGSNGLSVFITYNDSESKPNRPTGDGTGNGWHTDCTDHVVWMSQKIAESATSGEWGAPIRIKGEKGDAGIPGSDASFPDTLPDIPTINIDREGFKTISLSWTFNSKPYYTYELYASQERGFSPSSYDLIYAGVGSSFLHEVECSQTWYYRARVVNTYNHATDFSAEVSATTTKISDASKYFKEAAIGNALIGNLNADKITSGTIKGDYIDAKNLKIIDGNGNITLYVSSDGTVQNMTLYKRKDDGVIIGKIEINAQGIYIYDSEGEVVSYFDHKSAYIDYLTANIVMSQNLIQDATVSGCPTDIYVISEDSNKDTSAYTCVYSVQGALDYINKFGKFLSQDVTIHLEDNLNIAEYNLLFKNFMGSGKLIIEFGNYSWLTIIGSIVVDNCYIEIIFTSASQITTGISSTDYYNMVGCGLMITNQEPIIKGFGYGKITLNSLRLRSYTHASDISCTESYDGCNITMKNCEVADFGYLGYVENDGKFNILNSCGNTEFLVTGSMGGIAFVPSATVPTYTTAATLENSDFPCIFTLGSNSPAQANSITYVDTAPNGEEGGLYHYGLFKTSSETTTGLSKVAKASMSTYNYLWAASSTTEWKILGDDGYFGIADFGDISWLVDDTVTINKVTMSFYSGNTATTYLPYWILVGLFDSSDTIRSLYLRTPLEQRGTKPPFDTLLYGFENGNPVYDAFTFTKGMLYKLDVSSGGNQSFVDNYTNSSRNSVQIVTGLADWLNKLKESDLAAAGTRLGIFIVDNRQNDAAKELNWQDMKLKIEYDDTNISVGINS